MNIEELVKNLKETSNLTDEEWETLLSQKLFEERIHPELTEDEAFNIAINRVLLARSYNGRTPIFKSE